MEMANTASILRSKLSTSRSSLAWEADPYVAGQHLPGRLGFRLKRGWALSGFVGSFGMPLPFGTRTHNRRFSAAIEKAPSGGCRGLRES
jgi:hypothetical protein